MKHRILYIFTAFVLFASCEDSDYDLFRYSASLYYVKAEQDEVVFSALASSHEVPLTYTSSEWTLTAAYYINYKPFQVNPLTAFLI